MKFRKIILDGENNKILVKKHYSIIYPIININLILWLTTLLFIIIFNSTFVYTLSITEVKYSNIINESEYINISFKTDITENVIYQIYKDGLLVSNTNFYEEKTDYSYSGNYDFSLLAMNNNSTIISNITIEVLDVPLLIDILEPKNNSYDKVNISILVRTNHDSDTQCRYFVSGKENNLLLSESNKDIRSFVGSVILRDGSYEMEIFCEDVFDSESKKVYFSVENTNLIILSKSYSITQENFINLNLETNLDAECRYSIYNKTFYEMNRFFITNSLIHKNVISNMSEGGYKVYIACKGYSGDIIYDSIVVFLSTHPSAEIILEKKGPLKKGTYEVTLKTSKDVQSSPSLSFILANDNNQRKILLTGNGKLWKGYLFVEENMGETVGIFKFSAKDYNNIEGNIITSGEMFLIDTVRPLQPYNIKLNIYKNSSILISWEYDGEDNPDFIVYRFSEDSEKEKIGQTKEKKFLDKNIEFGKKYFYSVLAIDDAGNEGPISEESEVQIQQSDIAGKNFSKKLDSHLSYLVDEKIREVEKILIDITSAKDRINSIKEPDLIRLISILSLDKKAEAASNEIKNIISDLNNLKNYDLLKSELELKLNSLKMSAIKAQGKVVEEIIIDEKTSFEQILQESDVESAVIYFLEGKNLSRKQLKEYLLKNTILQDSVIVKTEVLSFRIRNLNQENYDKKTLVDKKIIISTNLENVSVVEIIPKEVENTASEIYFLNINPPYIIKEDPVVKWSFNSLGSLEYQYLINEKINIASLKNIKTVVLENLKFKVTPNTQEITGFMVFRENLSKISNISWLIAVCIIIIFILISYYFSLDVQNKNVKIKNIRSQEKLLNTSIRKVNLSQNIENNNTSLFKSNSELNFLNLPYSYVKKNETLKKLEKNLANSNIQEIMSEIDNCNFHINSFNYEKARESYNSFVSKMNSVMDLFDSNEKEELSRKSNYVRDKIEIYRKIHLARRHLYFKNFKDFSSLMNDINIHYGNIAYNIGFSKNLDSSSELKYLNFIADNIKLLKKHHEKLEKLK